MNTGEFNSVLREKIANIILYLTRGQRIHFVKILKLLYLTDEFALKQEGAPITWLQYNAWKRGIVPVDVYNEVIAIAKGKEPIVDEQSLYLYQYLNCIEEDGKKLLIPQKDADTDTLSDFDIEILDKILAEYGDKTTEELVEITHSEGSLWHSAVTQNNLDEHFKLVGDESNVPLQFISLLDSDFKKSVYSESLDSLRINKYF